MEHKKNVFKHKKNVFNLVNTVGAVIMGLGVIGIVTALVARFPLASTLLFAGITILSYAVLRYEGQGFDEQSLVLTGLVFVFGVIATAYGSVDVLASLFGAEIIESVSRDKLVVDMVVAVVGAAVFIVGEVIEEW